MFDDRHLATLEFPKVLQKLAAFTSFSFGRELALELRPVPFLKEAERLLAETTEARRLLSTQPDLSLGGIRDVRPALELCLRDGVLSAEELLDIRQTLLGARSIKRLLTRMADSCPLLAGIASRLEDCPGLIDDISGAIDDKAEVRDSASPALSRIRQDSRTAHGRLLDKLHKIIGSEQNAPYLQESLITQRSGRYVIPLRADFKGRIPGIVHDQSSSGVTLFVEPLSTVELNNRWRQAQIAEEQEVLRILKELSGRTAEESTSILHGLEALATLDLIFAKAHYAEDIKASLPALQPFAGRADHHPGTAITIRQARHPLLAAETVVPIDVVLDEQTFMLVITGPNTGGKTVSLKTVGLMCSMAQAGLHIPAAEGARLTCFESLFADIGDEQSIEQSLSTFSAHMSNIISILEECDRHSLVLLDELGAGTDPVEGAALAQAVLNELLQRKCTCLVATHYSELKAYAHSTPGVCNASVDFDLQTLSPTYHLSIGLPGRSNAFAIAERLGLKPEIISRARGFVGEESQRTELMLAQIKAELEATARQNAALNGIRREQEDIREQLRQRLTAALEERRDIINQAREDARREISATRKELRRLVEKYEESVKTHLANVQGQPAVVPPPGEEEAESRLAALEEAAAPETGPEAPEPKTPAVYRGPLAVGDVVWVEHLHSNGVVTRVHRGDVEVQIGGWRTNLKRKQVEFVEKPAEEAAAEPVNISTPEVESPGLELDLRGETVEEAMLRLERYLDEAYLSGLPWVRVIHGKGSGILRQAIRQQMRNHPLVVSSQPGAAGEGDEGVTIIKLANE